MTDDPAPRAGPGSRTARSPPARVTTAPPACSTAAASPRTILAPRLTARSTRPCAATRRGSRARSRTRSRPAPICPTDFGALLLRIQRELFVVAAELATNPERTDAGRPGVTQVTKRCWSGLEELLRDSRSSHHDRQRVRDAGRGPAVGRARGGARDGASCRTPDGHAARRGCGPDRWSWPISTASPTCSGCWPARLKRRPVPGTSHVPRSLAGANPRGNGQPA